MSYNIDASEFENTVTYLAAGEDVNPSTASIKSGQHHYIMAGGTTLTLPSLGSKSVEFVLTNRGDNNEFGVKEDANVDIVGNNIFEYGLDTPQGYSSATNVIKIKPYSTRAFLHWDGFWYEKYNPNAALPEVFEISTTNYNAGSSTDNYKSAAVYRLNPTRNTNFYITTPSSTGGIGFKYYIKNVSTFNITINTPSSGITINTGTSTSTTYALAGGQSAVLIAETSTQWKVF
jgi:hypothetical protein